jgi:cell division septum initiation protein DivIVA
MTGDTTLNGGGNLNGHGMAPPRPATPDDLRWELSYDRASVDRFLTEVDRERTNLQREIDAARAQGEAARAAARAGLADGEAALGAMVLAAQRELVRIEEAHREIVATIRAAAATEATRVLTAAHREAAAVREATASLVSALRALRTDDGVVAPTGGRAAPLRDAWDTADAW